MTWLERVFLIPVSTPHKFLLLQMRKSNLPSSQTVSTSDKFLLSQIRGTQPLCCGFNPPQISAVADQKGGKNYPLPNFCCRRCAAPSQCKQYRVSTSHKFLLLQIIHITWRASARASTPAKFLLSQIPVMAKDVRSRFLPPSQLLLLQIGKNRKIEPLSASTPVNFCCCRCER